MLLTELQTFNAMREFLEDYFWKDNSEGFQLILGDIQFFSDGGTADPAAWPDWIECTRQVLKERFDPDRILLTEVEGMQAMKKFLEGYHMRTSACYSDIAFLLIAMSQLSPSTAQQLSIWPLWERCIAMIVNGSQEPKFFYLEKPQKA